MTEDERTETIRRYREVLQDIIEWAKGTDMDLIVLGGALIGIRHTASEVATAGDHPELAELKHKLNQASGLPMLTGSGGSA